MWWLGIFQKLILYTVALLFAVNLDNDPPIYFVQEAREELANYWKSLGSSFSNVFFMKYFIFRLYIMINYLFNCWCEMRVTAHREICRSGLMLKFLFVKTDHCLAGCIAIMISSEWKENKNYIQIHIQH